MPVELVAPALLAKGAALPTSFMGGPAGAALGAGLGAATGAASLTPAGGLLSGVASAAAEGASGGPVIEQSLYLLPLLPSLFLGAPLGAPSSIKRPTQRTITLSTARERGLKYAEFL
ncbi:hypothetical protein, conserved [Eimeria tenella]|uniref:Uncharacterized protein n=1 Tax=Eimeria tenella TaxID=5802 RepID=U6L4J5_EIMTE|nr:hypothetical protein, conserved [Eimeria tenella]CDJ43509.1 hypothetical protein, conserved [Eimeria tenella]|eukprot:XP_013234259.1 hypothetical protein, conserved [Eimeria tenella]